jgi:NAD(P)-dependent dehydrogenase (short-subunit alcohol dehydrogenase family)
MLLDDKTAVIYGGGGSIGGAVARAFAREGARVFLAGRTSTTVARDANVTRSMASSIHALPPAGDLSLFTRRGARRSSLGGPPSRGEERPRTQSD